MNERVNTLAALIGTRICHDLISPIGAIGNGLELMSLGGSSGAEMALVSESLGNAQARIRFYRVAFGVANRDQTVPHTEARSILADMYAGSRMTVDWAVDENLLRPEAKLGFLLVLCAEAAMPKGGTLRVTRDAGTWQLDATAARLRDLPQMWAHLTGAGEADEIGADMIQFVLAAMQAEEMGRRIEVTHRDGAVHIAA